MHLEFLKLLLEQKQLFFFFPFEKDCFVFQRSNALYRSLLLPVVVKKSSSIVILERINQRSFFWPLGLIELFFCYCSLTNRCWVLEQGVLLTNKTCLTLTSNYNDYLLAPSLCEEVSLYNPSTDDDELLGRLS